MKINIFNIVGFNGNGAFTVKYLLTTILENTNTFCTEKSLVTTGLGSSAIKSQNLSSPMSELFCAFMVLS